ncbi:MAG TPA: TIR domain-containing protein [Caulobacteraceae bacterium]|jgi:TolB-like protein
MADVFISYKHEDRARVKPLVDALAAAGLSVWWDVGIEGGAIWRQSIQTALDSAKCVIVIWSRLSVGPSGEFVHDEASLAKRRGVYLPVTIDDVVPPLGFGQVQVLPLWAWKAKRGEAPFAAVLDAARALVGGEARPPAKAEAAAQTFVARDAGGPERPTIAVLPFGFPPGDQDQAYFAEAVAEDIISGLARSKLLTVMPRQSSLTFDAHGLSTDRICADLDVEYIVQGQVRRMGATVRVSAHLINGLDQKTVWSDRYDRSIDDLFAVQDEITAAIVSTIEPALLTHEEARVLRAPTRTMAHWDLFVRGRWHFWRSTIIDSGKAQELLTQALALKPDDAQTLSLLAHCCLVDVWAGVAPNPRQSIAEAHRHALKAVHLDGSDAFAHFTLGVVLSTMGRPDQDMAEQRRALELNPNMPAASGEMGRLLAFGGQVDEALNCCDRAIGASPNDPHVWLWLLSKAIACFIAKRHLEAATHAADACARRPDYFFLHYLQAACAAAAGRLAEAHIAMDEGMRLMPRYSMTALKLGHPFVNPGDLTRYVEALKAAGWVDSSAPESVSSSKSEVE